MLSSSCPNGDPGQCHPLTHKPTAAWEQLKPSQAFYVIEPVPLDMPISNDAVRFVCISDTHSRYNLAKNIPEGDVLLHAGDFTNFGSQKEIKEFDNFLGSLPHRYKIVIAGNHELSFDRFCLPHNWHNQSKRSAESDSPSESARRLLKNCIYLEDSAVEVYGISVYGTPWQPAYRDWAFNLQRGEPCLDKWKQIPTGVDVLLTHTPPVGHGDEILSGEHVGCVDLLLSIQRRIKPKYHVFGHIHESYGITSDGYTKFLNCSICNVHYNAVNSPMIFDLPFPPGERRQRELLVLCWKNESYAR